MVPWVLYGPRGPIPDRPGSEPDRLRAVYRNVDFALQAVTGGEFGDKRGVCRQRPDQTRVFQLMLSLRRVVNSAISPIISNTTVTLIGYSRFEFCGV